MNKSIVSEIIEDFTITLDYTYGEGDATRIFRTAIGLINAFNRFDQELVRGFDVNLRSHLALERVEEGSLKILLKTVLQSVDDDALKSGDWKKILGTYLVSAKYLLLKYLEDKTAIDNDQKGLSQLSEEIQKEAQSTELKGIPIYAAPSRTLLVIEILEISVALQPLAPGDQVFFSAPSRPAVEFNKRLSVSQASVDALLTERLPSEPSEAVLLVKKPVFMGDSRWEFLYQGKAIEAKMLDAQWVEQYRKHRVDVPPGSSLLVTLKIEASYNAEEKAAMPKYFVLKVHRVVPPPDLDLGPTLLLS
ncbi:hypothetical protein [Edaphobacter flagellatus]|uniref:hypothetical protein n=1 Tax=Edaphobacter flagellatus TaxID=1933044 RepID=UPI0021B37B2C|nr:hypothetical protein [Edaphobacter flagellatus]